MNAADLPNRLLRLRHVLSIVGLSKSAIYARIREGSFPNSISLGGNSVAWIEAEVIAWIDSRIAASRGQSAPQRQPEAASII